ncbi:MAG: hypothetical protein Q3968_03415 [Clostridiaceae bacterium]|nr:hypothetical protein [Clostridiaceae bacterium]
MKKALIITAVLFVISSLLVVVSAVALGADAIPKLIDSIKEGGILEKIENGGELFENIENGANEFSDKVKDGAENYVGDGMFNGRNFSIIGDDEYCIGGERADGLDVSSLKEIRIRSDVGSVKLVMTDNSKMSASYNLYSDKTNANPDEYELILFAENYDIWLKSDRNIKGCVSELTVEIPVDYDGAILIESAIGDVKIKDVELGDLKVKVDVGEITASAGTVASADFKVETGNITVAPDFVTSVSASYKVEIGSVEYALPYGRFVDVAYSVKTGGAETEELDSVEGITVEQSMNVGSGGVQTAGHVRGANPENPSAVSAVLPVNIEVGIGGIEFKLK